MTDGRRRRGRPTRFDPEIGDALIGPVINDDVPIKHAARRLGLGPRTVYDWLQRAQGEGAAPELAEWSGRFTQYRSQQIRTGNLTRPSAGACGPRPDTSP
jgi:transposase-like protein